MGVPCVAALALAQGATVRCRGGTASGRVFPWTVVELVVAFRRAVTTDPSRGS